MENINNIILNNIEYPKYKCACGSNILYCSIKKHLKSEKHKIYLKAKLYDDLLLKHNS